MAAIDKYKNLLDCLAIVKQRCDVVDTSLDQQLTIFLEDTFGYDPLDNAVVYRPYYVAAKQIEQSTDFQNLSKAGDVQYTGMQKAIDSLLLYQQTLDNLFSLVLPESLKVYSADYDGNTYYGGLYFNSSTVPTTIIS